MPEGVSKLCCKCRIFRHDTPPVAYGASPLIEGAKNMLHRFQSNKSEFEDGHRKEAVPMHRLFVWNYSLTIR